MDSIIVDNIVTEGRHGCGDKEKEHPQPFRVDVILMGDFSKASAADYLDDTVDYRTVIEAVKQVIQGDSVNLLETLAERIAESLLSTPMIQTIRVKVAKLQPPIPEFDGTVAVEIERVRDRR